VAQIIHIPLAFEFSPMQAKWDVRTVEIQGWARELRRRSLVGYIGSSDDVAVELLEPRVSGRLSGLFAPIDPESRELKHPTVLHWSDIPTDIKVAATPEKKIEEIRGSDFHILACESCESTHGRNRDAWAMRREFLGLKHDSWALLGFLRKWGLWDEKRLGSSNLAPGANAGIQNVVFPEGIWELQSSYRAALVSPPSEWLSKRVAPFNGAYASPTYPHFILEHSRCRFAIEATIAIDLLRKIRFHKCKRDDCPEIFEIRSRHKRRYCGQYCAHLESMRKQRRVAARLKKKKSTTKKGA
jgi:hypothetical protein